MKGYTLYSIVGTFKIALLHGDSISDRRVDVITCDLLKAFSSGLIKNLSILFVKNQGPQLYRCIYGLLN